MNSFFLSMFLELRDETYLCCLKKVKLNDSMVAGQGTLSETQMLCADWFLFLKTVFF